MHSLLSEPAFVAYAVMGLILSLNMIGVWAYSGVVRGKTKTSINKEDAERFKAPLVDHDPPEVARVLRAHANAQANIYPFLFLGLLFVLATAVYFGVFGEIYSLFPATSGDTFGVKYATTNNGMLYTAKGTASLLVPIASVVASHYGWQAVFVIAVALNATAALMALLVIKPMRRAFILGNEAATGASTRDMPAVF